MSNYYYKVDDVRNRAEGHWLAIFNHLVGDQLHDAIARPGRHVRCPVHGGKHGDAFRLFKDVHRTGGAICNTCGPRHDGFELLMWLNGWSFDTCLKAVGDAVGAEQIFIKRKADPSKPVPAKRVKTKGKGILVASGHAPYDNNPENEESFFITIRTKAGRERSFWGIDLPRALEQSKAVIGDEITLNFCGRTEVKVEQPIKDSSGAIVDYKEFSSHRNEWQVINHNPRSHEPRSDESPKPVPVLEASATPAIKQVPAEDAKPEASNEEPAPVRASNVIALSTLDVPEHIMQATRRLERMEARAKTYASKLGERHQKLWDECLPINSSASDPARLYFDSRGFLAVLNELERTDSVRFHPALPYYVEDEKGSFKEIGKYPAIVAAIRDIEGNLLTLHRIYLSKQGKKASVSDAKKMASVPEGVDINGGAIQMGAPFEGILGVAEGLETALAAYRATGIPVWSTVNAQLMKTFQIPGNIHTLLIWADLDKSRTGEVAANVLKQRAQSEGIEVIVLLPQYPIPSRAKSLDWNDVLLDQGRAGFPSRSQIIRYCDRTDARAFA